MFRTCIYAALASCLSALGLHAAPVTYYFEGVLDFRAGNPDLLLGGTLANTMTGQFTFDDAASATRIEGNSNYTQHYYSNPTLIELRVDLGPVTFVSNTNEYFLVRDGFDTPSSEENDRIAFGGRDLDLSTSIGFEFSADQFNKTILTDAGIPEFSEWEAINAISRDFAIISIGDPGRISPSGFGSVRYNNVTVSRSLTDAAPVPLPAGALLLVGGLAALVGLRKRKSQDE